MIQYDNTMRCRTLKLELPAARPAGYCPTVCAAEARDSELSTSFAIALPTQHLASRLAACTQPGETAKFTSHSSSHVGCNQRPTRAVSQLCPDSSLRGLVVRSWRSVGRTKRQAGVGRG